MTAAASRTPSRRGRSRPRAGGEGGFSMLEVLVAASLATVILGMVVAGWEERAGRLEVRAATMRAASGIRMARHLAQSEYQPHSVVFLATSGEFRVTGPQGIIERMALPQSVVPSETAVVTFSAEGRPDRPAVIALQHKAAQGVITIEADGAVSVAIR